MRCIAVDDEPLALMKLENYIARVPYLELVKSCRSAAEAMDCISKSEVDLAFLDINMPDLNGMDFAKSLTKAPMIIFTTAYSEYAIDGFKVNAVDYLLKPFGFDEFLKSVNKAKPMFDYLHAEKKAEEVHEDATTTSNDFLFVKSDYRIIRICIKDIKYIESMSEYVRIFVEGEEKPIITLVSMKKIEEKLPKEGFMRVHRSYMVNLQKVEEVSRMRIVFDKKTYIPIGELYKEAFFGYIDKKFIGKN